MDSITYYNIWLCCLMLSIPINIVFSQYGGQYDPNRPFDPDIDAKPDQKPPWHPDVFDNSVVVETDYGKARGFTVPWDIWDADWRWDWNEKPVWFTRRVNCFLGIPYASPPIGRLRFRKSEAPTWPETYEATEFKPACPQKLDYVRRDIPSFSQRNISEDCLYLNIFAPNFTGIHERPSSYKYPVLVWFHGGDFVAGTAQQHPGHVLATKEIILVSVNYRLGALGFLSLQDEYAPGNYGLWDQHRALDFIRRNIIYFQGNPDNITIMGDGAGAASVGLHLISPVYDDRSRKYFHSAILMSGSDLSDFGFIDPFWEPEIYGKKLAEKLSCPTYDSIVLLNCLKNSEKISWQQIVDAQHEIKPHNGKLGFVWGPTTDTNYQGNYFPFLPLYPRDARLQGKFKSIPMIIGLNAMDGGEKIFETVGDLSAGMFDKEFKDFIKQMLIDWKTLDIYRNRVQESIEFQYTYWPNPENATARAQEFIHMVTDLLVGEPMDTVIKSNVEKTFETYMYVFHYRSFFNNVPFWMGQTYSAAVPYVFGFPFLNESLFNNSQVIQQHYYDYEDRNMSDAMMMMFSNFMKYGEPTPNITYNITWHPFNTHNLSYLVIDEWSYTWFNYRQRHYSFWKNYFPTITKQDYLFPTPKPTPLGFVYLVTTGFMGAIVIILIIVVIVLGIFIYYETKRRKLLNEFEDQDLPDTFQFHSFKSPSTEPFTAHTTLTTIASKRPGYRSRTTDI